MDTVLDSSFDFNGKLCKFCLYFEIKMLGWHCQLPVKYTNVSRAISSQDCSHVYSIKRCMGLGVFPFLCMRSEVSRLYILIYVKIKPVEQVGCAPRCGLQG